jgi:hypothetical protein
MARKVDLPLENINPALLEVLELLDARKRMAVLSVLTDPGDDDELLLLLDAEAFLKKDGPVVREKFKKVLGTNPMVLKPLCDKAKVVVARPTPEVRPSARPHYAKAPEDPSVLIRTALDVRLELQGIADEARAKLLDALWQIGILPALQKVVTGTGVVKITSGFHGAVGSGNFRDAVYGVLRATWHDHNQGVLPEAHALERERVEAKRTKEVSAETPPQS